VDRSRDAPARLDQKPLLHDEIALEAAADLGRRSGATVEDREPSG
jgi:hypothetical protein